MAPSPAQGLLLVLLLLIPSECRAQSQTVSASIGKDVLLPCGLSPEGGSRLRWVKYSNDASKSEVILSRPPSAQDSVRGKWESDEKGQPSLFLTKLEESDGGTYSCEVCGPWDCTPVTNISLKVRECSFLPAMKVKKGTDVKLNCLAADAKIQQRPLSVSWSVLKGGTPTPVRSEGAKVKDTSLILWSASVEDSAWYKCSYDYANTLHCYEIKVEVQDADEEVTTSPTPETDYKRESAHGNILITSTVSSFILVILCTAAVSGIVIYYRRARRPSQEQPAGSPSLLDSIYYEPVLCAQSQSESESKPQPQSEGVTTENHLYQMCQ